MGNLPIVKYEGRLWYFDARCNELRDYYTAERQRLDSGMIEQAYFLEMTKGEPLKVFDADKTEDDENHVPHSIREAI